MIKNLTSIHKVKSKSGGFTLVETLIAIAILMVAIAGPLTIANQALTAALGSRDVMIASYLAQDGMESLKNVKDNGIANGSNNLSGLLGSGRCNSNSFCRTPNTHDTADFKLDAPSLTVCSSSVECKLYKEDSGIYTYSNASGSTITPFTRYYYVTSYPVNTHDAVVTVVVSWTEGSIPNIMQLQEIMSDAKR